MSESYGESVVEETAGSITNADGDSVVEVINSTSDTDWMYKIGNIIPAKANVEGFQTFNRTFAAMGDMPSEAQQEKLKPILAKMFALGFTSRCKDLSFTEEFYTWVSSIYSRNEIFMTYKKKGIKFKPSSEVVTMEAMAIALETKLSKFPNTDVDKVNARKDIAKNMMGLNAHILLGTNLESPLSFLILNTPSGEEAGDRINFETIGFNMDILLLATRYDVPVFNLNKEGSFKRLEDFIDNF